MTRKAILFLLFISVAVPALAQDTIFTDRYRYIVGDIYHTDHSGVYYTIERDTVTEDHWISRHHVIQIAYRDGTFQRKLKESKMAYLRGSRLKRPARPHPYFHALTLNAPAFTYIGVFPGVSVGAEYQGIIDDHGKWSMVLSYSRYWAGTAAWGHLTTGEVRSNLQGSFFLPGVVYHPLGNKRLYDIGLGIGVPLGTITRRDTYWDHRYVEPTKTTTLCAVLAQLQLSVYSRGRFVFALHGSAGPMFSAGATTGMFGQAGFKIGLRF